MRSLVWKEFREKRLWLIPLVASTVGVVLLGQGYTFCGEFFETCPWIGVSILVALLMGAGTYSNELKNDTTDFLFSRATTWRRVMLAKLGVGLGMILFAALVSALAYRLTAPEPYLQFATLSALAKGVGWAMLVMGGPYLIAAASSVVLPGTIGTVLAMLAMIVVMGVEALLINEFMLAHNDHQSMTGYLPFVSWATAVLFAGLLVARFGVTLSAPARPLRFVAMLLVGAVVATPVDMVVNKIMRSKLEAPYVAWAHVNPAGTYAAAYVCNTHTHDYRYAVRLSDRTIMPIQTSPEAGYWYNNTRYSLRSADQGDVKNYTLLIEWMTDGGVRSKVLQLGLARDMHIYPSPSGRWVAVSRRMQDGGKTIQTWRFVDIERGAILDREEAPNTNFHCYSWWVSDSEFAYRPDGGAQRTVRMPEE